MSQLSLRDLDFDAHNPASLQEKELREAVDDIRSTRTKLGSMTVRDTMEAVYGEAYTRQMLGDDGGKDVLMEELSAIDDLLEANGKDRRDVGGNRLPQRQLSGGERDDARKALEEQERVADRAVGESLDNWIKEDSKAYKAKAVADDINNMLPEERAEVIRLLQEQADKLKAR